MSLAGLHPLLAHFPVGLLLSGALFILAGAAQREAAATLAGQFNLRFGFWSLPPVALTGALAASALASRAEARPYIAAHIFSAAAVFLCIGGCLALRRRMDIRWRLVLSYLLLFAGMAGVMMAGYYGGVLAHRFAFPFPAGAGAG